MFHFGQMIKITNNLRLMLLSTIYPLFLLFALSAPYYSFSYMNVARPCLRLSPALTALSFPANAMVRGGYNVDNFNDVNKDNTLRKGYNVLSQFRQSFSKHVSTVSKTCYASTTRLSTRLFSSSSSDTTEASPVDSPVEVFRKDYKQPSNWVKVRVKLHVLHT